MMEEFKELVTANKNGLLKFVGNKEIVGFSDLVVGKLYDIGIDGDGDIFVIDEVGDSVLLTDYDDSYKELVSNRHRYFELVFE